MFLFFYSPFLWILFCCMDVCCTHTSSHAQSCVCFSEIPCSRRYTSWSQTMLQQVVFCSKFCKIPHIPCIPVSPVLQIELDELVGLFKWTLEPGRQHCHDIQCSITDPLYHTLLRSGTFFHKNWLKPEQLIVLNANSIAICWLKCHKEHLVDWVVLVLNFTMFYWCYELFYFYKSLFSFYPRTLTTGEALLGLCWGVFLLSIVNDVLLSTFCANQWYNNNNNNNASFEKNMNQDM